MRRISGLLATIVILLLAGCGKFSGEKREPWRSQAEAQCLARKQVRASDFMQPMKSISGPGACGMDSPFRVTAILNGTVTLKSRAVLACPMVVALEHWVAETVLPAARQYYGAPVAQIHFGAYNCRRMNNRSNGRRSEHSFGNAADFMSMTLADGRSVNVRRGWRGSPTDREFLRTIFTGACGQFGTVLGPGADSHHDDHFHLDLARHSRGRSICRPVIKWSPMVPAPFEPGPGVPPGSPAPMTPYGGRPSAPDIEAEPEVPQDHEASVEGGGQNGARQEYATQDEGGPQDGSQQASGEDAGQDASGYAAGTDTRLAQGRGVGGGQAQSIDDLLR